MKEEPNRSADGEILPPEEARTTDSATGSQDATQAAGAHLRMPPLIDHAKAGFLARWRDVAERFVPNTEGRLAAYRMNVQNGTAAFLRRAAYQILLWMLVTATLVVTAYGIWQARNMHLPQFDTFWFDQSRADKHQPGAPMRNTPLADLRARLQAVANGAMEADRTQKIDDETINDVTGAFPATAPSVGATPVDGEPTSSELTPRELTPRETAQNQTVKDDRFQGAALAEIAAINADKAALQSQLAALQAKLTATEKQAAALARLNAERQNAMDEDLAARFAMADLLLRLEAGLAYDDILAAGHLQNILSRREWALLALHGAVGLPTTAALQLHYQSWLENMAAHGTGRPYQRFMGWLAARGGGLVRVSEAPLALQGDSLAAISNALKTGRLDDAAIEMGRVLRVLDADPDMATGHIMTLQAVYDDTRAAAELAPMVAQLKRDYIAGVRP